MRPFREAFAKLLSGSPEREARLVAPGGSRPWNGPLQVAASRRGGWRKRAGRREPRLGVSTEDNWSLLSVSALSLWRVLPGVRKSSPRSPGRPRRRDGGGGDAAAGSEWGAAAAPWPAGVRWIPRPGGTMGSCPEKPRPRCLGWSLSCRRRCRHCPDRRRPPSAAAHRSPRRPAPRLAAKHKVEKRWPQGAAPRESHHFSTSS